MANFTPIKTIESKVSTIPVGEGKFIFCTDTGNIYIDASYGTATVVRRQGFPKYIRQPVELLFAAGQNSGLDELGDVEDPILPNTIVFVKEVEAYFYFDATSEAEPNGETIIKPEYIVSGAGRWIGFTTNGITPHIDESTGNWFLGLVNTGKPARGPQGYVPEIGENGNWYINGVDTTKSSKGSTPTISGGNWWIDGADTGIKAQGTDGTTPTIHPSTKHWMFGEIDSGIRAEGVAGTSSYTYWAYASDASGTGFSLTTTAGDDLYYAAMIVVSSPLTPPTASDFSDAVWVKYRYTPNEFIEIVSTGIDTSSGSEYKALTEKGSFASLLPKWQPFTRPDFNDATHLVITKTDLTDLDFSDEVIIIDTKNIVADRTKVLGYTGAALVVCPAEGFGGNFSRLPIFVDLSALTEPCILRYKWTATAGDSDWYVTLFPSNGEAYVAPPASSNDYTDAAVAKVAKIDLETLATLSGTDVSVAPWTQSKWSASGTCTLTASGWAESGRQIAYIVITLAAGSTPSVVGTEAVEDGDALSAAGVYECFLKNVDGKIYFRQISFTEVVA